jgi:hypothetical protein
MKKLVNLNGVKTLGKTEQKEIFGGDPPIPCSGNCGGGGGSGGGANCWVTCSDGTLVSAFDCDFWAGNACNFRGWTICVC